MCVVHGMAGVGKSYLVEHFATTESASFPTGYACVRVGPSPLTTEAALVGIAEQLGVPVGEARDPDALRTRLRRALVHVDGLDAEATAPVAASIAEALRGCPLVITTCLANLGIERRWPRVHVAPLADREALELLRREAGGALDDDPSAGQALVLRTGGLPLALHLVAGALTAGRSAGEVRGMLERASLRSDDPTSQADLRLPLQYSLGLLQSALTRAVPGRAAAIFTGLSALGHMPQSGVGRSLGAALAGLDDGDYAELSFRARALSIVDLDGATGVMRIHRLFAVILREDSDGAAALERAGAWFFARTSAWSEGGASHLAAWDEARAEREALVRWIEHTALGDGARVALTSAEFALRCGPYVAWTALLERSLPSTSGEPRADALILLARLHLRLGNLDRADQLAAQVARKGACNMHVARAAGVLAEVYDRRGEVARALDTITTVQRPTLKALGRERELAEAVGQQAEVMARSGAMTEAVVLRRREQLPILRRLGDDRLVAESLGKIVEVYQAQERWGEASRLLREEVMPTLERIGDPRARIAGMMQAVEDLFASGDPATAMEVLEAHVIPEAAFLGDANMHVRALARLADAQYVLLWEREAERLRHEEVYPRVEHLRDPHLLFWVLRHVADTYLLMGRHEMASCLLADRLLPAAEATGSRRAIATAHALRASVLLCEGRRADAIDVLRAQVVPAFEAPGSEHDWLFAQMRVLRLLTAEGRLDEALGAARGLLPTANRVGALDYCAPAIHDTAGALSQAGRHDDAVSLRAEHLACGPYRGDLGVRARALMAAADALLRRRRGDDLAEACRRLREARLCVPDPANPVALEVESFIARTGLRLEVEDATVRFP